MKPKKPKSKKRKLEKAKKPKSKNAKKKKRVSRLGPKQKSGRTKQKSGSKKPGSKLKKKISRVAKQHKAKGVPKGFVDVVQKQSSDEAYEEIKNRLESARQILIDVAGIDSRVRVHRYADGTIDGELLVKVPHGTSTNDVVLEMETAVGRNSMPGFWLNMGTRFTIKEDEEVYRRFRGFNDVNTHYQAARPANWSEIPLILRKVIVAGMEHKYGRKAESVYTRLHWSPSGNKPRNRG